MEFELKSVSREVYDAELEKTLSYFKLIPVSREHYNNEVTTSIKKRGKRYRQQKFDELEIAYYKSIGIEH